MDSVKKAEEMEVLDATIEKGGRTQKASISYTLKAMAEHGRKLRDAGMWTEKDAEEFAKIHKKAVTAYMEKELGF